MKYSAVTRDGNKSYGNFSDIMILFSENFLNGCDEDYGREFLYDFGEYLDKTKYPCNGMILDCFIGNSNQFAITLKYNDEEIVFIRFNVKSNDIITIDTFLYNKEDFKIFQKIVEDYFDKRNAEIFNNWMKWCNIKETSENVIVIDEYVDYNKKDCQTLNGTITEIFDKFTTWNDRYKYCNGHYWKFNDDNIEKLYRMFIANFKGNYFLENAVKRGVIID